MTKEKETPSSDVPPASEKRAAVENKVNAQPEPEPQREAKSSSAPVVVLTCETAPQCSPLQSRQTTFPTPTQQKQQLLQQHHHHPSVHTGTTADADADSAIPTAIPLQRSASTKTALNIFQPESPWLGFGSENSVDNHHHESQTSAVQNLLELPITASGSFTRSDFCKSGVSDGVPLPSLWVGSNPGKETIESPPPLSLPLSLLATPCNGGFHGSASVSTPSTAQQNTNRATMIEEAGYESGVSDGAAGNTNTTTYSFATLPLPSLWTDTNLSNSLIESPPPLPMPLSLLATPSKDGFHGSASVSTPSSAQQNTNKATMIEEAGCLRFETPSVDTANKNQLFSPNDDVDEVAPSYNDYNMGYRDPPPEAFMSNAATEGEYTLGQEPKDDPPQLHGDKKPSNFASPPKENAVHDVDGMGPFSTTSVASLTTRNIPYHSMVNTIVSAEDFETPSRDSWALSDRHLGQANKITGKNGNFAGHTAQCPPLHSRQPTSSATKELEKDSTAAALPKPKSVHPSSLPPPPFQIKDRQLQHDHPCVNAADPHIRDGVTSNSISICVKPPQLSVYTAEKGSELAASQQPDSTSSPELVGGNAVDRGSPLADAVELTPGEPNTTGISFFTNQASDDGNKSGARDAGGRIPNCSDNATTPTGLVFGGRNIVDTMTTESGTLPTRTIDTIQLNRMEHEELAARDSGEGRVISPNPGDCAFQEGVTQESVSVQFLPHTVYGHPMERGVVVDDHGTADKTYSRSSTQHANSGGLSPSRPALFEVPPTPSAQPCADGDSEIQKEPALASAPPAIHKAENLNALKGSQDHPRDCNGDAITSGAATKEVDQLQLPDGSNPSILASLLQDRPDQLDFHDGVGRGPFPATSVAAATYNATKNSHGIFTVNSPDSAEKDNNPNRDPQTISDHRSGSNLSSDTGASCFFDHASANYPVGAVDTTAETSWKGSDASKIDADVRSETTDHKGVPEQDNQRNCGSDQGLGHRSVATEKNGNVVRTVEKTLVNEGTQHGIAVHYHSSSDDHRADYVVSTHSSSKFAISDVGVTMPSIATPLETFDTQRSCTRDPIVSITESSLKLLIESDPVDFVTKADQGEVPEDVAVTSVSGATTPPTASANRSSICFANGSSDHDSVNDHVGDNDYCVTQKSSSGQYPAIGDNTEQPDSVKSFVDSGVITHRGLQEDIMSYADNADDFDYPTADSVFDHSEGNDDAEDVNDLPFAEISRGKLWTLCQDVFDALADCEKSRKVTLVGELDNFLNNARGVDTIQLFGTGDAAVACNPDSRMAPIPARAPRRGDISTTRKAGMATQILSGPRGGMDFTDSSSTDDGKAATASILPHKQSLDNLGHFDVNSSPSMSSAPPEVKCCVPTTRYSNDVAKARASDEYPSGEDNTTQPALKSVHAAPFPSQVSFGQCHVSPWSDSQSLDKSPSTPQKNTGIGGPFSASAEANDNSSGQYDGQQPRGEASQSGSNSPSHWHDSESGTPCSYPANTVKSTPSHAISEFGDCVGDVASYSNSGSPSSEVGSNTPSMCDQRSLLTLEADAPIISTCDRSANVPGDESEEAYESQDDRDATVSDDSSIDIEEVNSTSRVPPNDEVAFGLELVSFLGKICAKKEPNCTAQDSSCTEMFKSNTDGSRFCKLVDKVNEETTLLWKVFFEKEPRLSKRLRDKLHEFRLRSHKRAFVVDVLKDYARSQAATALGLPNEEIHIGDLFVVVAGPVQEIILNVHEPWSQCSIAMQPNQLPPVLFNNIIPITTIEHLQNASVEWRHLPHTLCQKIDQNPYCKELVKIHGNLLAGRDAFEQAPDTDDEPMEEGTAYCLRGDICHQSRIESGSCQLYCSFRQNDTVNAHDNDEATYHRTAIIADMCAELWSEDSDLAGNDKNAMTLLLLQSILSSRCEVPSTFKDEMEEQDERELVALCNDTHEIANRSFWQN